MPAMLLSGSTLRMGGKETTTYQHCTPGHCQLASNTSIAVLCALKISIDQSLSRTEQPGCYRRGLSKGQARMQCCLPPACAPHQYRLLPNTPVARARLSVRPGMNCSTGRQTVGAVFCTVQCTCAPAANSRHAGSLGCCLKCCAVICGASQPQAQGRHSMAGPCITAASTHVRLTHPHHRTFTSITPWAPGSWMVRGLVGTLPSKSQTRTVWRLMMSV